MMKEVLTAGLPGLNLQLPEDRIDTLVAFGRAMVKQNEVMNLTGITDDKGVANLHLLDSLTVLSTAELSGKSLIDVGCGAGFPGVPLAIAAPDARITLLDSLGKRMKWLEEGLPTLGISGRGGCCHPPGKLRFCHLPGRCPAEHSAGADGSLCEGGRCGAGHEGHGCQGRAGGMCKRHQKAGSENRGSPGVPH